MKKPFQGINVGKNQIDLTQYDTVTQFKPIEIHHKQDGDINDQPSFTLVMTHPVGMTAIGQISLEMFNEGLADIGYEIVKKK